MSEFDVIKKTKKPKFISSLVDDLKRIGIKTGDIVLIIHRLPLQQMEDLPKKLLKIIF